MSVKTVYLVRHAQSEQNVAIAKLRAGAITAIPTICWLGLNAPLSNVGQQQVQRVRAQLETENFIQQTDVQLVAHSHYYRARDTARGLFGTPINGYTVPLLELPFMYERTVYEYFTDFTVSARVAQLRGWLQSRPEKTIALVGHGQMWKQALSREDHQDNVSILECEFDPSATTGSGLTLRREVHTGLPVELQD